MRRSPPSPEHRHAPVRERHDRLPGAELDYLPHPRAAIVVVGELVAHEALGLELVRAYDVRTPAGGDQQRLALGVEHGADAEPLELVDQAAVQPTSTPRGRLPEKTHTAAPLAR